MWAGQGRAGQGSSTVCASASQELHRWTATLHPSFILPAHVPPCFPLSPLTTHNDVSDYESDPARQLPPLNPQAPTMTSRITNLILLDRALSFSRSCSCLKTSSSLRRILSLSLLATLAPAVLSISHAALRGVNESGEMAQ